MITHISIVDTIAFWVVQAERPVPADEKSGLHFCFAAPDAAAVGAFHTAALRAGGRDNGAPGLRPIYGPDYYAAFIIDPDGYRIEAYYGPGETYAPSRFQTQSLPASVRTGNGFARGSAMRD
jgi:hypothetical protein